MGPMVERYRILEVPKTPAERITLPPRLCLILIVSQRGP